MALMRYSRRSVSSFTASRRKWLDDTIKCAMEQQGIYIYEDLAYEMVYECEKLQDLQLGRKLKSLVIYSGLDCVASLADHFIRLFANTGSQIEANQAFSRVSKPTQYTWNAMLNAHSTIGEFWMVLPLFDRMLQEGTKPDKFSYPSIPKTCSRIDSIEQGRGLHEQLLHTGLQHDVVIASTLVDMYSKCGSLMEALKTFDRLPTRNIITWNSMLSGCVELGEDLLAMKFFAMMQIDNMKPDKFTFPSILKSCCSMHAIEHGRCIHEQVFQGGFYYHFVIGGTLVDMYAKCGSLEEAEIVFKRLPYRNVVTWNSMIAGYAQVSDAESALKCFEDMHYEVVTPDEFTFSSILKACSGVVSVEQGRCIHEQIVEHKFQAHIVVGSSLLDFYTKCKCLDEAYKVFVQFPGWNAVAWNTMIAGYTRTGEGFMSLQCFEDMCQHGIKPNKFTFPSILKACGTIGAINQGRCIHNQIIEAGLVVDVIVGITLIDIYMKCGCLQEACIAFDNLPVQNTMTWNAMIVGCGYLGKIQLAVQSFQDMLYNGINPNDATFTGILSGFNHAGLIDEGLWYFRVMTECCGIKPSVCQVNCMVDLLGHGGCFNEVKNVLRDAIQPDACVWMTLLSACELHCNMELGRKCFDVVIELDSFCDAAYVLMSNIYACAHMERGCADMPRKNRWTW